MSGASEQANGQESCPALTSRLVAVLSHYAIPLSAPREMWQPFSNIAQGHNFSDRTSFGALLRCERQEKTEAIGVDTLPWFYLIFCEKLNRKNENK